MTRDSDSPSRAGSPARLLIGIALFVGAIGTGVFGFVTLAHVLESGGHGTRAARNALVILGAAGGCLAAGIATVIWDLSKRFER